jgi:hypothetical protein
MRSHHGNGRGSERAFGKAVSGQNRSGFRFTRWDFNVVMRQLVCRLTTSRRQALSRPPAVAVPVCFIGCCRASERKRPCHPLAVAAPVHCEGFTFLDERRFRWACRRRKPHLKILATGFRWVAGFRGRHHTLIDRQSGQTALREPSAASPEVETDCNKLSLLFGSTLIHTPHDSVRFSVTKR